MKSKEKGKIMYHATFGCYTKSIMEKGLGAEQHKNWSDSREGYVYLDTDPDCAISFCEVSEEAPEEVYASGIALLEVNVDGLELHEDDTILWDKGEVVHAFMHEGIISPDRIEVLYELHN